MTYGHSRRRRPSPGTQVRVSTQVRPHYLPAIVGGEDCMIKLHFEATLHLPEKPRPAEHADLEAVRCFRCGQAVWLIELGRVRSHSGGYIFERGDYCATCAPFDPVTLAFSPGRDTDRVRLVGWEDDHGRLFSEFDEATDRWVPLNESRGFRWTHKDVRDHQDKFDGQTRRVVSLRTPKTPRD